MSRKIKSQFILRRVGQQRYLQGGPHQRGTRHFVLRRHLRRCDNHLPKIFLGGRYKDQDGYCLIAPFKFILRVSAYAGPLILRLILRSILLTRIFLCRGSEEDAESGLEVGRLAGGVSPAELDAVGEHEGARPRVQHVVGGRVDIARDELEVRILLKSVTSKCKSYTFVIDRQCCDVRKLEFSSGDAFIGYKLYQQCFCRGRCSDSAKVA